MSRMTAKMSAAALVALGSLVVLPGSVLAQDQAAPAAAPAAEAPVAPPAAEPAPAPAAPAAEAAPAPTAPAPVAAPAPAATPAPATPAPAATPAPQVAPAAPAAPPAAQTAPAPAKPVATPPEQVTLPPRPVLSYTGTGRWEQVEDKLGSAFESLAIAAKKAGVTPTGAPLVQYLESDDAGFSFVVMLPVDKPTKGKLPKGIKAETSPAGPALRFSPSATADDLEEVYARIDDYLSSKGLGLATMVEEYGEDAIASPEDRVVVDIYVFVE